MIDEWPGIGYPDFVAEGSGDQVAINGAICAAKKATFDGVDCVGVDDAATGTVSDPPPLPTETCGDGLLMS